jgi:hypothetical protein
MTGSRAPESRESHEQGDSQASGPGASTMS